MAHELRTINSSRLNGIYDIKALLAAKLKFYVRDYINKIMKNYILSKTYTPLLISMVLILIVIAGNTSIVFSPTFHRPHIVRQADTADVARNLYQVSMNPFYPRIHSRGNGSGISGMEFPVYNFAVASIYKLTHHDWLGYGKILSSFQKRS